MTRELAALRGETAAQEDSTLGSAERPFDLP
jgi:hypothetical protein